MTFEQAQAYAQRCRLRWESNKDGFYDIETNIALVTQAGTLPKSYPQTRIHDIDVEAATVEFSVEVEVTHPKTKARLGNDRMWVALPFANVASFTDSTSIRRRVEGTTVEQPQARKIVA